MWLRWCRPIAGHWTHWHKEKRHFRRRSPGFWRNWTVPATGTVTRVLLGTPQQPGGAEGFHQSAEYIARVMTEADAQGIATVQLKNRFYAGDRLEVLQPGATNVMIAPKFRKADTGEEMDTYGVAGTLVKMQFPFPVAEGDLIRGVTRNHRR